MYQDQSFIRAAIVTTDLKGDMPSLLTQSTNKSVLLVLREKCIDEKTVGLFALPPFNSDLVYL